MIRTSAGGFRRTAVFLFAAGVLGWAVPSALAINITLDYTLDAMNEDWFGDTPAGAARRAAVDSAAAFLSSIIVNDDWGPVTSLSSTLGLSDIDASSIFDLSGQPLAGTAESDGRGYSYTIPVTNRTSVAANEYVVYVSAFEFDFGTTAHAKAIWRGDDRRNAAGLALAEFNTWGGYVFFDSGNNWYTGSNPGVDPRDDYGEQDPDKTPATDIASDNWDWSTTTDSWKGFQLASIDLTATNRTDLYGTALHELLHALGASDSNMDAYVGVEFDGSDEFFNGNNLVAAYGGPVPGDGGHFAANVQSPVWGDDEIISEALLDPNSTRGVRKYLTQVDAALLRDLGYQVLADFDPADFNRDGAVSAADLAVWQSEFGASGAADADGSGLVDGGDLLVWQQRQGPAGASPALAAVPEPTAAALCAGLAIAAAAMLPLRRPGRPQPC